MQFKQSGPSGQLQQEPTSVEQGGLFPSAVERKELFELLETPEEKKVFSRNIAQVYIFSKYFNDEHGNKIGILEDETLAWLSERYGEAMRDFCDAYPEIASHIYASQGEIGHLQQHEIDSLVLYMKTHVVNPNKPPTLH